MALTEVGQRHRPRPRSVAVKMRLKDIAESEYHAEGVGRKNYITTRRGERASRVHVMGTVVEVYSDPYGAYQFATLDDGTARLQVRAFESFILADADVTVGAIIDVTGKPRRHEETMYIIPEVCRVVEDPDWVMVRRLELAVKYNDKDALKDLKNKLKIKVNELKIKVNEEADKPNISLTLGQKAAAKAAKQSFTSETKVKQNKTSETNRVGIVKGQMTITGERYPGDIVRSKRKIEEMMMMGTQKPATTQNHGQDKQRVLDYLTANDDGTGVKYIKIVSDLGFTEDYADALIEALQADGRVYEPKIGRFKRVG